jgi:chromate transporter
VIAWFAARAHFRGARTRLTRAIRNGVAPVTVRIVLASGFILATGSAGQWWTYAIAIVSTVLASATRLHPLWLIVAGALVGALA